MNIANLYIEVRTKSEQNCKPLLIEDYVPQSIYFASPPKWNLAHTTWFFEEFVLKQYVPDYKPYHELYSFLFNSYYEGAGERTSRNDRGTLSRPSVDEIYKYRKFVDDQMLSLLGGEMSREIEDMVILGINHEQQHQELFFTDHKYALSRNPLYPHYGPIPYVEIGEMPSQTWIAVEEGIYEIGHKGEGFFFDNEVPNHKVYLQPFEISNRLVTNGEYIEFIEAGGYLKHEFWHEEGWKWLNDNSARYPIYWQKIENSWLQFTLAGLRPLQSEHPLTHVNYFEAFAFASFRGMRLPTEFEWEAASESFNWGDRWEWTESAYLPYPGYKKTEGTVGEYNGKFMVNQKVLRGSSIVSPKGHSRKSYRNFFHAHLGWQYNGIRLVK